MPPLEPTSSSRAWRRRGLALAVLLWVLGVAVALPRYVARRDQEAARGAARVAAAKLEGAETRPAPDAARSPDLGDWAIPLLLLGTAWASVVGLAWLWRQAEDAGASAASETGSSRGASGVVESSTVRREQTRSGETP